MTNILINRIKSKYPDSEIRGEYSNLSGKIGIVCNFLLCAVKFILGLLTGAVSITADAVNNLFDCMTNVVTITSAKLSNKPDDKEHPFGHGRIEYVSALIVAVSVFVVGFELAKTSVEKIVQPSEIKFSVWFAVILFLSVGVKVWMAYFNYKLYKLTNNLTLKGVMQDSINDAIATSAVAVSIIISQATGIKAIDGIIGLLISIFIFVSGVKLLKDVLNPLIGEPPSKEITEKIEEIIKESDVVLGVHDLIIHSYGANKTIASADAEVDANRDIFTIHNVIDEAERKILDELNIIICIHMDPVDTKDDETHRLKALADEIVSNYNPDFSFHDFRLIKNGKDAVINFDLTIPFDDSLDNGKIAHDLESRFKEKCPDAVLEMNIEHPFV